MLSKNLAVHTKCWKTSMSELSCPLTSVSEAKWLVCFEGTEKSLRSECRYEIFFGSQDDKRFCPLCVESLSGLTSFTFVEVCNIKPLTGFSPLVLGFIDSWLWEDWDVKCGENSLSMLEYSRPPPVFSARISRHLLFSSSVHDPHCVI